VARQRLREYLANDRYYINFHAEEIAGSDVMGQLLAGVDNASEITEEAFVAQMRIYNIGLWLDKRLVIMDYMIDPETSNEILAVKAKQNGHIVTINWEN
jgi:hypothetical protein